MNKPARILTTILVTLTIGGMFAYQDSHKERTDIAAAYQQHPTTVILTDFFCGGLSGLIFYFGSGWLARRKKQKSKQAVGDNFYDDVTRELQDKILVSGLWTKAFSEMGGDGTKARALYIKYRAEQLAEANRQRSENKKPEEQTEPPRPPKPEKQIANAPTNSKAGKILAILAGVIIVIVILANLGSDSTSTTNPSSRNDGSQSGGSGSGYTPPSVYAPPVCKALDDKNGFKDFKFGMTSQEAREIMPPSDVIGQPGANVTIFHYRATSVNRIGDFSTDILSLGFYEDRLYRIDIRFSNSQNEILDALKVNYGEPSDSDLWKRGDQPLLAKAWQGQSVSAAILAPPGQAWDAIVMLNIEANKKEQEYAAKEPERAAKDFGTNGFKTLVLGTSLQDVSLDFTVSEDDQATGVKKVIFKKDGYGKYIQSIGFYPLMSVSAEFFHDKLYRIDLSFSENQKEIFATFKQRFGQLQDNDTWARDSMKLKAKSSANDKLFAAILAPDMGEESEGNWDAIVLLDASLWKDADQFKKDAPKRAAKDF
jgi:hypothetical protein